MPVKEYPWELALFGWCSVAYGLLGMGYIYVCKNVIRSLLGVESCNTMLDYPPYHVSVGVGYCSLD